MPLIQLIHASYHAYYEHPLKQCHNAKTLMLYSIAWKISGGLMLYSLCCKMVPNQRPPTPPFPGDTASFSIFGIGSDVGLISVVIIWRVVGIVNVIVVVSGSAIVTVVGVGSDVVGLVARGAMMASQPAPPLSLPLPPLPPPPLRYERVLDTRNGSRKKEPFRGARYRLHRPPEPIVRRLITLTGRC